MNTRRVSVIGLGYVGMPVAAAFARIGAPVVAFDIDTTRIAELRAGVDRTQELTADDLRSTSLHFTCDPADLAQADFHIITVPTPITRDNRPDLRPLLSASATVGRHLKPGDIVVYESTVFPGCTQECAVPVLERESGLTHGKDFTVGYSPERINPGDRVHRFETITKVVSGSDAATLNIVAAVYGTVVKAGIHRAPSIAVAEAAKVIENTQRDINIALMNELAVILDRLDIDTRAVLEAAGTKWNFLPFSPGLVGGHCIGVDPYYLTHRAEQVGYIPQVILAGRRINDSMGSFVATQAVKRLMRRFSTGDGPLHVAVLGATFKENVPDIRNSKVFSLLDELRAFGITVSLSDPLADAAMVHEEYGWHLTPREHLPPAHGVILAVPHAAILAAGQAGVLAHLRPGGGVVVDVKSALDPSAMPPDVDYWRL